MDEEAAQDSEYGLALAKLSLAQVWPALLMVVPVPALQVVVLVHAPLVVVVPVPALQVVVLVHAPLVVVLEPAKERLVTELATGLTL